MCTQLQLKQNNIIGNMKSLVIKITSRKISDNKYFLQMNRFRPCAPIPNYWKHFLSLNQVTATNVFTPLFSTNPTRSNITCIYFFHLHYVTIEAVYFEKPASVYLFCLVELFQLSLLPKSDFRPSIETTELLLFHTAVPCVAD